jgi:hypothetical protein
VEVSTTGGGSGCADASATGAPPRGCCARGRPPAVGEAGAVHCCAHISRSDARPAGMRSYRSGQGRRQGRCECYRLRRVLPQQRPGCRRRLGGGPG